MAIQSQPSRIPEPFAGSGTKNTIPATNTTPSASQAASWASGFPPECSQPISAGGCPVPRNDVNGVLSQLSQDYAFRQDGGVWEWSALADYDTERVVRGSDGLLYYAVAQSGPGVAAGAQDPTLDTAHIYWASPNVLTMPATDSSSAAASTAWVNDWFLNKIILPQDFYVDTANGDDNNDGFSAATAKKTLKGVYDLLDAGISIKYNYIGIKIAPGVYTGADNQIRGVTNVVTDVQANEGTVITDVSPYISDFTRVVMRGSWQFNDATIQVSYGSQLQFANGANITFDNLSNKNSIYVYVNALVFQKYGSSVSFAFTGSNSGSTNVQVSYGSAISFYGTNTWSGSFTGKRYDVFVNSFVRGVGGANVIPGTTAGTATQNSYFG